MAMTVVTDQQLKQLLADPKSQRKGFEMMVCQYSEQLYWHIRRIVLIHEDANDVLQNVFIKAWNGLDSFHGESKLLTWLSRIAVNESIDFVRKQKHQQALSMDGEEMGIAQQLMADEYFDGNQTEAQLQEAVAQLPDVQRTVFNLRYFEEMKYSEISKITGTSEGALKASYHIAVKKIRDFFEQRD
jgi:RNA polymerase sigma-70 factor (ECF subfamily)